MFKDKLRTRAYCDEDEDYALPCVFSTRDLVINPDLSDINWTVLIES